MTLADGLTLFADGEGLDWKRTLELAAILKPK
jgi:hypothetical protein